MNEEKPPFKFFLLILLSLFLAVFYSAVANMAGLYIVSDLGGGLHMTSYPIVFFGLGNLVSLPLANPLANFLGPIRLLSFGLVLFSIFSFACGVAPTFFAFNVLVFFTGFSCGFFYVLCRRLILEHAEPQKAYYYLFYSVLMYSTVPTLAACIGGTLAYEGLWTTIYHLNEPICLALAYYFWKNYHKYDTNLTDFSFDLTAYISFFIGLVFLVTAATLSQYLDWYRSSTFIILIVFGSAFSLFFVIWQFRVNNPIIDLSLLKSKQLSFALVSLAILSSTYFGTSILLSLWLHIYANYTPSWVSFLFVIMLISGAISIVLMKGFLNRLDPRYTLGSSIFFLAVSCYYSIHFDVQIDLYHLCIARFFAGMGLALYTIPIFRIALNSYGEEKGDSVFLIYQIGRSLFNSLGAGLYVILWQRRQVFFYERLGEGININSQLTMNFYSAAENVFYLTKARGTAELENYLNTHSTSLALNDVFGFMGYLLVGLFILLISSFFFIKKINVPEV